MIPLLFVNKKHFPHVIELIYVENIEKVNVLSQTNDPSQKSKQNRI